MASSGDVTIAQDGEEGNVKLHPYLIAFARWCVSCLWSTATVLLHRLLTTSLPLPPITAPKLPKRPAGTSHLHPDPLVECEVLYEPPDRQLDVIFVHGLYGSLENTWRQGEWRTKYKVGPKKVSLRRPSSIPTPCACQIAESTLDDAINDYDIFTSIEEKIIDGIQKITEDDIFTEQFCNKAMLHQVEIVDNYEAQVQFVNDLFKYENENKENCIYDCSYNNKVDFCTDNKVDCEDSDKDCDCNNANCDRNNSICDNSNGSLIRNACDCVFNNQSESIINKDISGNKEENKVCQVGCGCICDVCYSPCWPRDWIKVDYPNARVISINYTSDPHLWRPLWIKECRRLKLHERAEQMMDQLIKLGVGQKPIIWVGHSKGGLFIKQMYCAAYEAYLQLNAARQSTCNKDSNYNIDIVISKVTNETENMEEHVLNRVKILNVRDTVELASKVEDDEMASRASLWSNSAGFMFYSVPHRGSPLADIKAPLTIRSVELLEIAKDCSLVQSLQSRWLRAIDPARPVVRSLVETCRTLMSVLWLRIVSVDSADPGIGAVCGVSVDHREICKPTSRHCLLYTELMNLMKASLNQCRCQ